MDYIVYLILFILLLFNIIKGFKSLKYLKANRKCFKYAFSYVKPDGPLLFASFYSVGFYLLFCLFMIHYFIPSTPKIIDYFYNVKSDRYGILTKSEIKKCNLTEYKNKQFFVDNTGITYKISKFEKKV